MGARAASLLAGDVVAGAHRQRRCEVRVAQRTRQLLAAGKRGAPVRVHAVCEQSTFHVAQAAMLLFVILAPVAVVKIVGVLQHQLQLLAVGLALEHSVVRPILQHVDEWPSRYQAIAGQHGRAASFIVDKITTHAFQLTWQLLNICISFLAAFDSICSVRENIADRVQEAQADHLGARVPAVLRAPVSVAGSSERQQPAQGRGAGRAERRPGQAAGQERRARSGVAVGGAGGLLPGRGAELCHLGRQPLGRARRRRHRGREVRGRLGAWLSARVTRPSGAGGGLEPRSQP
mmetsp:Transcript_101472/g.287328  ORF Transcript_101472/g.287328 Transcript_101472/m.287328 type:complete len:290 (-) Transcript_101472:12-881(-)